jgi:hypothetical protein
MRNIIYYRQNCDWDQESESANKYFETTNSRMQIKAGDLVIPRFSALPFNKELEDDINYVGAKLINSNIQHRYIADLINWYDDLKDYTPKTYTRLQDLPEQGPFVLKGETNSKKFLWKTHMFAQNKQEAIAVESRLHQDSLITYQNIYIREFVKLKTFMTSIQDLPITNEYRFFCYKDQILSGGYYWSSHVLDLEEIGIIPNINEVPKNFLNKTVSILKDKVNFYVIDVAETFTGEWIVIELNDGCLSGMSENNADIMYSNLKKSLEKEQKDNS